MPLSDWRNEIGRLFRPRYSGTIALVCFVLLLVPLPAFLQLDAFRRDYGGLVGATGVIAYQVWFYSSCFRAARWITMVRGEHASLVAMLAALNPEEQYVLARGLIQGHQSATWSADNRGVLLLRLKNLVRVDPCKDSRLDVCVTISPGVWKHLSNRRRKKRFIEAARAANPRRLDSLIDKHTQSSPA